MKYCLIDSGPMYALFDSSDSYHKKTVAFIKSFKGKFVTSLACVTETTYLLDFDKQAQFSFLDWIGKGAVEIVSVGNEDVVRVIELFKKYSDLPMDFADGCLVAISEIRDIKDVATIDSDFEIYRRNGNQKFRVHIKD
jgi:predicted nucleic acid-binding protein